MRFGAALELLQIPLVLHSEHVCTVCIQQNSTLERTALISARMPSNCVEMLVLEAPSSAMGEG